MSEHIHAHDCDCGEHHHHHKHGPDCGHSHAEDIVENALVYSRKGEVQLAQLVAAEELLQSVTEKVGTLADLVAVDGAVLGHVKALLECPAGKAGISFTQAGVPGIIRHSGWNGEMQVKSGTLVLNVLSLVNTDAPVESAAATLFN